MYPSFAVVVLDHLHQNLAAWHLEACWPVVEENLRSDEESLLVLLDGLDEVPTSLRQTVVQAVQELAERYPQHRYVVTCRPYAYVGQPWPLRGFTEVTLAPFDQEQIEAFIATWYRELARRQRLTDQEAQDKTIQLQRAVRQGDLWGLARRPLLLTVMTLLHSFRGQLPEDRTELYADAVDLLLRRWEQRVSGEAGLLERLAMPGLKLSDLEAGLYDVAFKAHSAATAVSDTADVAEAELRAWLAPYLGDDWNKAGQFVAYIRERAGLLVRHKTEAYTFPHRTFQEFMAACHLVTRVADYPGEAARLVRAEPDRWREVFVLAAGHAARTHRLGQAIAAVNALCPAAVEETDQPGAAAFRRAMLAGEALLEIGLIGVRREEAGRVALSRIQSWLPAALGADQELEARERAAAGNTLARLDDPRPGIGTISALRGEGAIPDLHFCHVPAGSFWLGEDEEEHLNESLNYDYWLSRYPVTNAQFAAFVEAGGYRQPGYWPEARAAKVWQDGRVQDRHDDRPRTGPVDFGEPFNLPNHPVVGLTWYEALAFCRWLGERIANCDLANLPMSQAQQQVWATIQTEIGNHQSKITLPSEAEWEKAARGPSTGSGGPSTGFASGRGRLYPWGDEPDPNRANYNDSGIGATSPVGCFPGGKSPYGCEEMSGNVWEWTRSLWGKDWGRPDYKYPYDPADGREDLTLGTDVLRVLRGGAFGNNRNLVRGAVRLRDDPDSWSDLIGFRVVVVGVASR